MARLPEQRMWDSIRPVLRPFDPVRIESQMTGSGIPDVNYTHGWIELKYAHRWPPRGGPLRIDHFTHDQRVWHLQRKKAGGLSFVLLKVGKAEWILFDGAIAALYLGDSIQSKLYDICLARWTRLPKTKEIQRWLLP